jgi:hypothetical protein
MDTFGTELNSDFSLNLHCAVAINVRQRLKWSTMRCLSPRYPASMTHKGGTKTGNIWLGNRKRRSYDGNTLSVVCGLGKMSLISEVSPELFELKSFLFDGMKTRQNPESTNYRYSGVRKV